MDGLLLGWFTTFLVALGVVLMLVIAVVLLPRAVRMRTASFVCPWRRRTVTVRYVTCDGTHPVTMVSCTAFADPTIVTCGAPCICGEGRPTEAGAGREVAELLAD